MELIKYPNAVLFKKNEEVVIDNDFKKWTKEVENYIDNLPPECGIPVGLAAPQVGRNIRAFVVLDYSNPDNRQFLWFVNPTILWTPKGGRSPSKEGCYSLEAGKFDYTVWRHYAVRMKWQDLAGEWHDERIQGYKATILQHEYDHLSGVLCNHEDEEAKKTVQITQR